MSDFSDEEVEEFIALWKKEFGETLAPEQVRVRAHELIEFCRVLSRKLPGEGETQ